MLPDHIGLPVPKRPPDLTIGDPAAPYLRRWYLFGGRSDAAFPFNIMLHQILRDDDDRALHDHPWDNVSMVLSGKIRDVRFDGYTDLSAGDTLYREAASPHRIMVSPFSGPAWTMFVAGPKIREWGFHCPQGWRHWAEFVDSRDRGVIGRGCE
jgi:hypothetical protein